MIGVRYLLSIISSSLRSQQTSPCSFSSWTSHAYSTSSPPRLPTPVPQSFIQDLFPVSHSSFSPQSAGWLPQNCHSLKWTLTALTYAPRQLFVCSFRYFYRAMHFSAKRGIAIACRLSVCLSVRL